MDVQFWYTSQDKLAGLEIKDGRIIALSDAAGYYYDMGGKRHRACNLEYVTTLPDTSTMLAAQNGQDTGAILDLLYITPDGVFAWDTATSNWVSLVPIDVKEANNDGYGYVRQNKDWTKLRWLICSRNTMDASSLSGMIQNAVQSCNTVSVKISGEVNMNNDFSIESGEGKNVFLDLTDANFTGQNKLVLKSTGFIHVQGGLSTLCTIAGTGSITLNGCDISNRVQEASEGFYGKLSVTGCRGYLNSYDALISCVSLDDRHRTFIIQGCMFENGSIELPHEDKCYYMISGNIFKSTRVVIGGTTLDPFYNNVGEELS